MSILQWPFSSRHCEGGQSCIPSYLSWPLHACARRSVGWHLLSEKEQAQEGEASAKVAVTQLEAAAAREKAEWARKEKQIGRQMKEIQVRDCRPFSMQSTL